jgi:hypothetical protein
VRSTRARRSAVEPGHRRRYERHRPLGRHPITGNPRLRKLLEDNGKAVVFEYYRRTGLFQPNHHVIVQNRILREYPRVALELFDAFQRSKEIAYERARRSAATYLYFPGGDQQEQAAVLGDDRTPSGSAQWARI